MKSTIIKPHELVANLETLRGMIARKPVDYSPQREFPRSIHDSFSSYTRTSHVNFILAFSDFFRFLSRWPFPFFVLSFCDNKSWLFAALLQIGVPLYVSAWFQSPRYPNNGDRISDEAFAKIIDKTMVKLFRISSSRLFRRWKSEQILADHQHELDDIRATYLKGYWYPCVTATFPLLDYVCRKLLKTENLLRGVGQINKAFEDANIDLESLRPGHGAWDFAKKSGVDVQELSDKDLRSVGVALESFLWFAKDYYRHATVIQDGERLNRHIVLHGAKGRTWTREDATRMLLFLDLMLDLVPVFEILFASNEKKEREVAGAR